MVQLLRDAPLDRVYTWGLDLSGSVQGAGGIGGRLALDTTVSTKCSGRWPAGPARSSRQGLAAQDLRSGSTKNYWFLYDANGNVGQVLDATNLSAITTAAKYEYDPYGNTLSATGTYAASNPFRFSTKWFDTETGLGYWGYRYYSPRLGRWISRDPIGEEGGENLYQYVGANPIMRIDVLGMWGEDIHGDMTRELAKMAGISCADAIAQGCLQPDIDYWRRPGKEGVFDIIELVRKGKIAEAVAKALLMAEWHFPVDPDGNVRKNSYASRLIARRGIMKCDFKAFSEGLHVLQDSWSHQGKPYILGVGHYRGVGFVPHRLPSGAEGYYVYSISGTELAALTATTDVASFWPRDVREAGMATYKLLTEFSARCPCHCPGEAEGSWRPTVVDQAKSESEVAAWLGSRFRGENILPDWMY